MNTLDLSTAGFGAAVGAIAVLIVDLAAGLSSPVVAILAAAVIIIYIIASATSSSGAGAEPGPSGFTRGILVGINSALNGLLGSVIWGSALGSTGGVIVGIVIALVGFISVFPQISESDIYQGFLGWFNWLMPTSWLVVGLGLTFFVLSAIGHIIGLIIGSEFLKVKGVKVDWKTGTFFMKGGFVSNLNFRKTAFNMGNFAFVHKDAMDWHMEHEAGHSLNLGAFGSVFHLVGAVDENVPVIGGRGSDAYAERIAESNVTATSQTNIIPMWS